MVWFPSTQDAESALSPLQGANMFAGSTALSNIMAQQQAINNAMQAQKNANALAPSQLAISQNQAANAPAVSAAGLAQSAATTAATQKGVNVGASGTVTSADANKQIFAELQAAVPGSAFKSGATDEVSKAIDARFPPDDDETRVDNVMVSDFAAALKDRTTANKAAAATSAQNKEFAQLGQRMDTEVKSGRGNALTQMINLSNQGSTLIAQMGSSPMPQQLTQLQQILGSISSGGLSSGAGGDYSTLLNSLNSKIGFLTGRFGLAGSAELTEVLTRIKSQLDASKQTALNTLHGLLEASADAYPDLRGNPQVETMINSHMNALNNGMQLASPAGLPGAPAAPSSGWSIVK